MFIFNYDFNFRVFFLRLLIHTSKVAFTALQISIHDLKTHMYSFSEPPFFALIHTYSLSSRSHQH